jgi:hypothetical protein
MIPGLLVVDAKIGVVTFTELFIVGCVNKLKNAGSYYRSLVVSIYYLTVKQ